MIAYMDDPDAAKPNPIHSTATARDFGFQHALVGGVVVYGWATGTILDALGEDWLANGWAEVRFRRPIYPGDALRFDVADDGELVVSRGEEVCISGTVGLGDAPWSGRFSSVQAAPAEAPPVELPALRDGTLRPGVALPARAVSLSRVEAEEFARHHQRETNHLFYGDAPRVHPGWLAARPNRWLRNLYEVGPSIHTMSQIQHRRSATAGQQFVVNGNVAESFRKRERRYISLDTAVRDQMGKTVAAIRHTSVFPNLA